MAFRTKRDLTRHQVKHHPAPQDSLPQDDIESAVSRIRKDSNEILMLLPQHSTSKFNSCNAPIGKFENANIPSVVVRNSEVLVIPNN